jgi:flagellar biosynthesis protein FlhG
MKKQKKVIRHLARKTFAVSSGKGGVGKTTTAVNLALYYAKKNLRVGLIDLDPLSDVATLLDLEEPEAIFTSTYDARNNNFRSHVLKVFDNFDLIFPYSKLEKRDSISLLEKLYARFAKELNNEYDILLFDLPAGVRYEDNLIFLHHTDNLILVTNAEPSAHVSAGGYIKSVLEYEPDLTIHLWHNKFARAPGQTFNPSDVIGNYNKNVTEEERLAENIREQIKDLAFIPQDASLDLLQTHPSPKINLMRNILDLCEFLQERRLADLAGNIKISPKLLDIIKYFLIHTEKIANIEEYLASFGKYLTSVIQNDILLQEGTGRNVAKLKKLSGLALFTDAEQELLKKYLTRVKADGALLLTNRLIVLLEKALKQEEEARTAGGEGKTFDYHKPIDSTIGRLLLYLNVRKKEMGTDAQLSSGLLLFYFSIYKLFQSPTILKLIIDFIPKKKNARGRIVRDKNRQIRELLLKNREYQERYFRLIKTLYPVVNKQVSMVVNTFNLSNLVLKDKNGNINKIAYLTLFTNFIHETVNSGLSVIVGFKHRPAAKAFEKAAELLLQKMTMN